MQAQSTPQTIACAVCGTSVRVSPSQLGRKKYCSRACQRSVHPPTAILTCQECGKEYRKPPSQGKRSRYCSKSCQVASKQVAMTCQHCDKQVVRMRGRLGAGLYCSVACSNRANGKKRPPAGVPVTCPICGTAFRRKQTQLAKYRDSYCSSECAAVGFTNRFSGIRRNSVIVPCGWCRKPVAKPKSRVRVYSNSFCDNDCYHAWDTAHKQTEESRALSRERGLQMLADGVWGQVSSIEDRVADWLSAHGIPYERQVRLSRFWICDFKVGDTYIEVHGCFWHGCPIHRPALQPWQKKRRANDKGRETYCQRRNIPLLTIWEHDVLADDFSVLSSLWAAHTGSTHETR